MASDDCGCAVTDTAALSTERRHVLIWALLINNVMFFCEFGTGLLARCASRHRFWQRRHLAGQGSQALLSSAWPNWTVPQQIISA